MITETNEQEYEPLDPATLKLIEFYLKAYGPHKILSFILEDISRQNPDFPIYIVDFDEDQTLEELLDVKGVPVMLLFKDD